MFLKFIKLIKLFFFSFMLAVCIVLGIAVVIPKRKDEACVEAEINTPQEKKDNTVIPYYFKTGD